MILTKPRLISQERLDLEDLLVLFSGLGADSKFQVRQFWSENAYVLKGFEVTGLGGASPATVSMTDATLINPNNTGNFSWFTADNSPDPISVPLNSNSRNYLEIELTTVDGTPLTRAFWDPSADGGLGAEFNQSINTVTNIQANIVVLLGGFSGSANRLPLAIVDTDSGNNIKLILDQRVLFYRLGTVSNPLANFTWDSRKEPEISLTLSGVTGSFLVGETVNIGSETAKVQTGGTTSIGVILPSSTAFAAGNTVTGGTSGATGTLSSGTSQFTGADKSIGNLRDMLMAMASEIKAIKGTSTWPEATPISLADIAAIFAAPNYEEKIDIVASGATGNQRNGPVTTGTLITIPTNSRLSGSPQQNYIVGKGALEVYLNGQILLRGVSGGWSEVGSTGASATQIQINQQLEVLDTVTFRIGTTGGSGSGSGGGGGAPDDDFVTLASSGAADDADYILIWDTSAGAYRKQLRSVFLAGLSNLLQVHSYSANHNANVTTDDVLLVDCTSGPVSITLPSPATSSGKRFEIKKIDSSANALTIVGTIDGGSNLVTTTQYESFTVVANSSQWWAI